MKKNSIEEKVIEGIIIRLTFDGSIQRARLYKKNVSEEKRKEFRKSLELTLPKYLNKILSRKRYSDNDHYKILANFSEEITIDFKDILEGNKFRVGSAQKFLNLYWKVTWLLKKGIRKPIHCPFDSIIIKKLDSTVKSIAWTKINSINEYKQLVNSAQLVAGKRESLAEWELNLYWENRD